MNLREAVDRALDALAGPSGEVAVEADGRRADLDVVDHDRLGVRVRSVRVVRPPVDVADEAGRLADARGLPDAVVPVEVDRGLGGAILRSAPEDHEFVEVDVRPDATTLRRWRAVPGTERAPADVELTRGQLRRLLETIEG